MHVEDGVPAYGALGEEQRDRSEAIGHHADERKDIAIEAIAMLKVMNTVEPT